MVCGVWCLVCLHFIPQANIACVYSIYLISKFRFNACIQLCVCVYILRVRWSTCDFLNSIVFTACGSFCLFFIEKCVCVLSQSCVCMNVVYKIIYEYELIFVERFGCFLFQVMFAIRPSPPSSFSRICITYMIYARLSHSYIEVFFAPVFPLLYLFHSVFSHISTLIWEIYLTGFGYTKSFIVKLSLSCYTPQNSSFESTSTTTIPPKPSTEGWR